VSMYYNTFYKIYGEIMIKNYTLEYWLDDEWYVGRLKDVPGVFSQGETLNELEENIKDALIMILKENASDYRDDSKSKEIVVEF
jgi:predicted RNase H-like HicB family nuclease